MSVARPTFISKVIKMFTLYSIVHPSIFVIVSLIIIFIKIIISNNISNNFCLCLNWLRGMII